MSDAPTVERVRVSTYDVPTDQPEADGTLEWSKTTAIVVQVTAGGRTGLGYTYAGRACQTLVEDLLAGVVLGCDAMDVPGAWAAMVRQIRNLGRPGITSAAIAAVDVALWDLKAKLLDLPLCLLLGRVRDAVPVYGSGGFTTYDDDRLREQLEGWVQDLGIPRVKIKIGESWGTDVPRDLARIAFTRDVVGPDVEVFVDANGGYSVGQAVRVAQAFADCDVRWFEEPVSSDDLTGLAEIRGEIAADVAAGEYGYDLVYFGRMCAAGAVDCLQADVSRCGGITDFLRVAAVAAAHGLDVSGHCAPALHLHPATAVPNLRHLEYFHDHARLERMLFDGVTTPVRGQLPVDLDRPGLGLDLKTADADEFLVDSAERTAG